MSKKASIFKQPLGSVFLLMLYFVSTQNLALAGYQLDPIRLEVKIPEGKRVAMTSLKVASTENEPIRLRVSLTDWLVDEKGILQLSDIPVVGSLMDRIRLNPKEFEILPGSRQIVRLAVSLPADAKAPCEYHSMVMLEDLKTATQHLAIGEGRQTSLFVKKRIGIALYIYYGDPKAKPLIKHFQVERSTLEKQQQTLKEEAKKEAMSLEAGIASHDTRPCLVHLEVINDGDRHSQLSGSVLALRSEGNGKEKVMAEFTPTALTNLFILPHQRFLGDIQLTTPEQLQTLPPGHYRFKLTLQQKNPDTADTFKAETEADL
jgi:hypothetical protein